MCVYIDMAYLGWAYLYISLGSSIWPGLALILILILILESVALSLSLSLPFALSGSHIYL